MYRNTQLITLTANSTTILTWAGNYNSDIILTGSPNLFGGPIAFVLPAGPNLGYDDNACFTFYYFGTPTNYIEGTQYISINGEKLRAEWAQKEVMCFCQYNKTAGAWKTIWLADMRATGIIAADMIAAGAIDSPAIGSNAVTTTKVLDDAITLPKIADQANNTLLGNVSGGAASPVALTATQSRTMLDQDVTLTGHVTGTATQTFATGDTSVATTIAANTITVAMCTNTVNTDPLIVPISMETGALTAGSCYIAVKVPYACTIEEYGFSVNELIEGTDDATITIYNTAGVLMGTSGVTVTKNTKPSAVAAGGAFFNSSGITSNNSISTGNLFYVRVQKTTAGGRGFANIKIKRA